METLLIKKKISPFRRAGGKWRDVGRGLASGDQDRTDGGGEAGTVERRGRGVGHIISPSRVVGGRGLKPEG